MVFLQLSKGFRKDKTAVFLGAPEAEAEALPNSRMPLSKVYKDHGHLVDSQSHENFIVVGRKGSGKSALAEHICSVSHEHRGQVANQESRKTKTGSRIMNSYSCEP